MKYDLTHLPDDRQVHKNLTPLPIGGNEGKACLEDTSLFAL
jgi:hypothetical protein